MNNIKFLTHPHSQKHSNGDFHPECPERLQVIEQWINQNNFDIELVNRVAHEEILMIHSQSLYNMIKKTDGISGLFHIDADTTANAYTFKASTEAVATSIEAIKRSSVHDSFFALVRPPGHHAHHSLSSGFCIFNNIAIATNWALKEKKYSKIAIIDFDHHYGNGTAAITGKNPDILYISTHADPRFAYPGCGFVDEIGEGDGKGTSIAIPLSMRATEHDIHYSFKNLIEPLVKEFKPEALAISVGFDAYERDPIGILGVTKDGYSTIGKLIASLARELKVPVSHYLEGGYNLRDLATIFGNYVTPFTEDDISLSKETQMMEDKVQDNTKAVIHSLKSILNDYWTW